MFPRMLTTHQTESVRLPDFARAFQTEPHDRIDVGHSRLAYWRFGSGPDVVFVHGWPLHSATFRKILPTLAGQFTCHLFDLPGTGKTESDGSPPIGVREHAETVRAAIDRLGLERYAFVAHDSGGAFARIVAAEDSRVSALVLGNTEIPGHHPQLIKMFQLAARVPGSVAALRIAMKSGLIRKSALGFGGCFSDSRYVDGEFYDLFVRPVLDSQAALETQFRLIETIDWALLDRLGDVHRQIKAPVLLIWGTDDPFFPLAKARKMLDQFGGIATLHEIPGAKLFAHEDHAREFGDAARLFLLECLRANSNRERANSHG
jgi:pimeloyl-ACP methyl ester carboxylesterase